MAETTGTPGVFFSITLKLQLAGIIAFGCLAALGAYFIGPRLFGVTDMARWREDAKFVLAVIGGGVAIYSAWHAGLSFRAAQQQSEERRREDTRREETRARRERQATSFRMINALNAVDKVTVRRLIDDIKDKHLGKEQVFQKVNEDTTLWQGVVSLLGELEDMAIAARTDYADERVLSTP